MPPGVPACPPHCRGYQGDGKSCAPNAQALQELQQLYWSEEGMQASWGLNAAKQGHLAGIPGATVSVLCRKWQAAYPLLTLPAWLCRPAMPVSTWPGLPPPLVRRRGWGCPYEGPCLTASRLRRARPRRLSLLLKTRRVFLVRPSARLRPGPSGFVRLLPCGWCRRLRLPRQRDAAGGGCVLPSVAPPSTCPAFTKA